MLQELLEPPADPMQVAISTLTLSTFVAWIYLADLEGLVRDHPGVTGLFPVNDAFTELGLLANYLIHADNREVLQDVLRYHLLDEIVYAHQIKRGNSSYPTLHGDDLPVQRTRTGDVSASPRGYPANVTKTDLLTSNGVLHQVDKVLLPPDLRVTIVSAVGTL